MKQAIKWDKLFNIMPSLKVKIRSSRKQRKKFTVEVDANKFERLAADFGFFNPEFLKSIERAEKDYKMGRAKKINSLRELRK